ncbi:MAG: hypothetical protein VST68_02290 [Nitrospirota bacterium]|nr:hypothetical protein [Nitrospirota bacterium]
MKPPPFLLIVIGLLSPWWSGFAESANAEWTVNMEGAVFYTDDVGLFSSSRRLSLQEDPTQPVVDVTDQGEDVVFEPIFTIGKTFSSRVGETAILFRGQGFVFADHSRFSHGTFGIRLEQTFPSETMVGLRYHYGPNLFLGNNEDRRSGSENLVEERVTTHFLAGTIEREVVGDVRLRVLGRYGLRLYNEAFAQRDTHFWTVGPHMEWEIRPGIELTVGYHFERGLADGRNQPEFHDDVSYINHYVSTELEVGLCAKTTVELALHYEQNDFTSNLKEDERKGATEDVLQGDVEIRHRISDALEVNVGFQRSQRKASFEPRTIIDVNVWIGGAYQF